MHCANFNVDGFATDSNVFPGCWKASLFFLSAGLAAMSVTVMAALLGCCVQSIGRKSIFNLAGVAQAIAGNTILFFSRGFRQDDETRRSSIFPRETFRRVTDGAVRKKASMLLHPPLKSPSLGEIASRRASRVRLCELTVLPFPQDCCISSG